MRIVLDTNIYISSIVFKGICREVFLKVTEFDECFISPFVLHELSKKLVVKFLFSHEEYTALENDLLKVINLTTPQSQLPSVCRDDKDNNLLQLAQSVNAHYLVTGDNDLLIVNKYLQTSIISPSVFLKTTR